MTKAELEGYRQELFDLGKRLRDQVSEVAGEALRQTGGEASGKLSNAPVHPADLGTDLHNQQVAVSLLQNEEQMLEEIAGALERLEQGTFGRCQECGQEIPELRLQALPYTPYCVACASAMQEQAKAGT